jgi:hypothetical protein
VSNSDYLLCDRSINLVIEREPAALKVTLGTRTNFSMLFSSQLDNRNYVVLLYCGNSTLNISGGKLCTFVPVFIKLPNTVRGTKLNIFFIRRISQES